MSFPINSDPTGGGGGGGGGTVGAHDDAICDGFCYDLVERSRQHGFYNIWSDDGTTMGAADYLCSIGKYTNTLSVYDVAWYDAVCAVALPSYISSNFYGEEPTISDMLPHVVDEYISIMEDHDDQAQENQGALLFQIVSFMDCGIMVSGCNNPDANNYNADANTDDGSCEFDVEVLGCTNSDYDSFDYQANVDDGSCVNFEMGIVDDVVPEACPYDYLFEDLYTAIDKYKSFQTIGVNNPIISLNKVHNSSGAMTTHEFSGDDGAVGNYNDLKYGGVLERLNDWNVTTFITNEQAYQFRIAYGTIVDIDVFVEILSEAIPSALIKDIDGLFIWSAQGFYGIEELTSEPYSDAIFEFEDCPSGIITPDVPNYNLYGIFVPNAETNVMADLPNIDFSAAFSSANYGCTDEEADNYNSYANADDGSCYQMGCVAE